MRELKKHASLCQQVGFLRDRGLIIQDSETVEDVLCNVNYYRLSGYLHNFKQPGKDCYIEELTWERLKRIYDFDRKLTRILMYALEDIEETFKTRMSYAVTSRNPDDPLIYLNPVIYREYEPYLKFLGFFYREKANNYRLPFVAHHDTVYGGMLPFWVAVELFTMGNLQAVYSNLKGVYQKAIARTYNTGPVQLNSWIRNLTDIRNHLAHYMRVYCFNFGYTPAECFRHKRMFEPSYMIFDQIYVMSCMYSDIHDWNLYVLQELHQLIDEYDDDIDLACLGFPEDWESVLTRRQSELTYA